MCLVFSSAHALIQFILAVLDALYTLSTPSGGFTHPCVTHEVWEPHWKFASNSINQNPHSRENPPSTWGDFGWYSIERKRNMKRSYTACCRWRWWQKSGSGCAVQRFTRVEIISTPCGPERLRHAHHESMFQLYTDGKCVTWWRRAETILIPTVFGVQEKNHFKWGCIYFGDTPKKKKGKPHTGKYDAWRALNVFFCIILLAYGPFAITRFRLFFLRHIPKTDIIYCILWMFCSWIFIAREN